MHDDPDRPAPGEPDIRPGRRPWLTPNVKVLSTVSLLRDTVNELLYPILPIFLTTCLGS
jgi:hypothetical protein